MATWEKLLADIRNDLQDTGATPRFTDAILYLYTKDAVVDYSQWLPRRIDRAELAFNGSSYPLPADFVEEIYVECPLNRFLERRLERPGLRYPMTVKPYLYFVESGSIYINASAPDEVVCLTYHAIHPVPTSETDLTFKFTIPDSDFEIIRLYVKAKAYGQVRSRQANLDRFREKGNREDNPMIPEVSDLMKDYERKLIERIPGGAIRLYRSGRSR